ncbi:MAG: GNAT family N-acetyltransferase, partial [Gammaproteobacteria bacterium]
MITIRKAQANDVPAIWSLRKTAIYKGCAGFYPDETLKIWAEAAPTDAFKHKVERDCYLAMLDERMVGMGMLNQHSGQVDALFMDSEHMGQGIGKEILAYLENLARESGLKLLQLDASLNA